MKTKFISLMGIGMLVFGALLFTGCEKEKESSLHNENLSERHVFEQVEPVLQTFLNTQYDYVIGKSTKSEWSNVMVNQEDANRLQKQIDEHKRDAYQVGGFSYTDFSSEIEWEEQKTAIKKVDTDVWQISGILENYTLNLLYRETNDSYRSQGSFHYTFVVTNIGNEWKIISYEEIHPFTIIPGDPIYGHRWHISVPDNRANVIVPGIDDEEVETRATNYNRTAAKNYAHTYWNSPNTSAWCDYTNNGGDCTNFVSQCLYAGGWTKQNGSYCSNSVWYHNGAGYCWNTSTVKNYSCSWTQASNMYSYLSNSSRVYQASYPLSYYGIGDVIQLSNSSGTIVHTMIVTAKPTSTTFLVTYRNAAGGSNEIDLPLNYITNTKYYWRLKNSYGLI